MVRLLLAFALSVFPIATWACDTALVLMVDVSNSVDVAEYRLQTDGMAAALRDPQIVDEMVRGQVAIAVVQWSGIEDQALSVPWQRIRTALDARSLAAQAHDMERAFILSDTAPAEAIYYALELFSGVPDCKRKVIDVSGDGTPNAGSDVRAARAAAERAGVTINGLAIESMGLAITGFYRNALITRNGFVMTALTHRDYPRAIRAKILREISKVLG
ncbi:DUF1194 domain-containing protein [Yoonia sp.]|uniref:DUF1194 domain-containing protein n=1 Tax=Yoonia sp. TaxID=2212373 RepID=UPI003F6C6F5E